LLAEKGGRKATLFLYGPPVAYDESLARKARCSRFFLSVFLPGCNFIAASWVIRANTNFLAFMKNMFWTFVDLLVVAASAYSCKSERVVPESHSSYFKADRDNQTWEASYQSAVYFSEDDRFVVYAQDKPRLEETINLSFSGHSVKAGFRTSDFEIDYRRFVGSDVITDEYNLDSTSSSNSLEITRYDSVNRIIEGKFNATLKRNARYSSAGQMVLQNGEFSVRYEVRKNIWEQ
jgi:hypothetical protein